MLRWPQERWVEASAFEVPAAIREAQPRLALDRGHSRGAPPFAINAGLLAGRPTLLLYEPVWPRNYFEAIFASQFGSLDDSERVEATIARLILPLRDAHLPLLRAFRLETLVRFRNGTYERGKLPGAMPRFHLAEETLRASSPRERWRLAASKQWDPLREVIVEQDLPTADSAIPPARETPRDPSATTRIQVLVDSADHQVLDVQSPGGVLITSELFYPGWRVRVDGVEASPLQVDLALRGVQLGAGRHRVEWDYRPTWLKQAIAATAVGILLLLALPLGLRGPSACDRPTAARATRGFDKRAPEVQ